MISHRSKKPSTPSEMTAMVAAAVTHSFDMIKEDPGSAPRSLSRSHSFDDRSYVRFPLGPALAPGVHLNWDPPARLPLVTSTNPNRDISTVSSRRLHPSYPPPPPVRSRAFFDVVLAPPVDIPAKKTDATLTDLHAPSKPTPVTSRRAAPAGSSGKKKKKKATKRREPTPEPESSSSEDESVYDLGYESNEEDVPAPARGPVKLIKDGDIFNQPDIPISDVRDDYSLKTCLNTRMQFDREYSRHTRPIKKFLATKPSRFSARNLVGSVPVLPVRKSSRLAATRSATPASTDMDSATDISISFAAGSSRAVSVASTTATTPRSQPRPKPKPKIPRSKSTPRLSTSSNSSRDQSTPQPISTSIAYSPDDPPPPAPTNQWFLDFVDWVFRQNVRAGKAEICQDIFQQAPHHRLESWKSYWRDHISQVEMLRNRARERLVNPEVKRRTTVHPSRSASISSDGVPTLEREANRASEGLWQLAEVAESQGTTLNRGRSNKRVADDTTAQRCTKRSRA
ncbi:hypothetical protein RhiXN_00357 [Rhizoctonia solani]|uniref:Uncharacterized protein n=1 Tax=Rhizoctonia solani TaxID=456999 RepID=A0A8H8NV32_9AGAM|nr:uncharacterized protein RhiXN_00357 [Rhizoctonia solani]QRW18951.1 hypothetical protein RhiXN_00357 [Rhizoctonia solani]